MAAIDCDPFCPVCGGPFSHVRLQHFSQPKEEEGYLINAAYNIEILSAAQTSYISRFKIIARTTDAGEYSGSNHSSDSGAFISNRGKWRFEEDWESKAPDWVAKNGRIGWETTNARFEKFFPLHAICTDILERFIQHQCQSGSPNLLKSVTEFVDACTACQEFSREEFSRIRQYNQRCLRPWDYDRYGSVEWSHLYFGARRFWSAPWGCEPGQEYLCADPMTEPEIDKWLARSLARPKLSFANLFSLSTSQLQLQSPDSVLGESPLMRCPTEILRLITSHLPLRSVIHLHASSRRLSAMISENEGVFWRSHTLRLHSSWFWELEGYNPDFSSTNRVPSDANWQNLLIMLSLSRRKIMAGARPWWLASSSRINNDGDGDAAMGSNKKMQLENVLFPLPLTLRNRQRIWMCLESLDVTGETVKVQEAGRK